jgi:methyltransferase (TIGR00027 family)
MSGQALPGVSRTAVLTAAMRASEAARADRLFDDELAGLFVSAAGGGAVSAADLPAGANELVAIRARFFDDQIRAACAAGIRQVILLAAGLDCRAFRLDWPGDVRLFELDLPEMFAFKESVLASAGAVARCARVVVTVDLRGQWAGALTDAGFDLGAATAWAAEGLLPYLQQTESERLLATVAELSVPGSRMVFDHIGAAATDRPVTREAFDMVRQQVGVQLTTTADSPAEWLARHGWRARLFRVPALGEDYGRPMPPGMDTVAVNALVLTAASR